MEHKHKHKPDEYVMIRLWHVQSGSYPYYWKNLQDIASEDNAPVDALYKREDGWITVSDLSSDHPFRALASLIDAKHAKHGRKEKTK